MSSPGSASVLAKQKEFYDKMVLGRDKRFIWCSTIVNSKVTEVCKQFIMNKTVEPENYTTIAYDKNRDKSRYDDILCIDATRVILKDRPAEEDFIHANWMTMPDNSKFICTQGPMEASLHDFWHMVVTERSSVVVMITTPSELGSKCTRYFPLDKAEDYGPYKVSFKEMKDDPFPGIHHLVLEATGGSDPLLVHHFIYHTWTDNSAPVSAAPAVGLLKLAKNLAAGAPITVHCSAGIGRAAAFIGIDFALQKLNVEDNFKMIDVLKDLRGQRFHAIRCSVQYLFIHLCVLEHFAEEGVLPSEGAYEKFKCMYQILLKKFVEKNAEKKE